MIISVTRLRLRSIRFLPAFMWHASRSLRQSNAAEGNRRTLVRRIGLSFWTLTAWEDEASLRAYMLGGAHGKAMPKLKGWCDEASTVRWEGDREDVDWARAETMLGTRGRLHPVRSPSPAHASGRLLGSAG